LKSRGGQALAVATDVTDPVQVRKLVDAGVQAFGRIDVLVNNAGLMPHPMLALGKVEDWNRMIDVNIKGVLYGIAAALPHMQKQKSGHIINVSSVAGHKVGIGNAVYSATKHAVRVISEGLRQEVKPYNLRTTIISPGAVAPNCRRAPPSRTSPPTCASSTTPTPFPRTPSRAPWRSRSRNPRTSTSTRSCSGRRARNCESGRQRKHMKALPQRKLGTHGPKKSNP
jgi:NAD(P)-dependent dehydrogenase (short-subunit alcohol dehydrogenase family)